MKRPDPNAVVPARRALLGAGLGGAALAAAGCASLPERLPARPLSAPQVRPGDRWRYAVINRYNGEKTGEVIAQVSQASPLQIELTDEGGRRLGAELYSAPWQVIQEPFYDQIQIFDRPVPLVPWDVPQGDARTDETAYRTAGRDERYAWYVRSRAVQWERLRVPAGEFDTLRVQRDIWFAHTDRSRLSPSRRETLWYAPQVNRWVQREWTGHYHWFGVRFQLREDWVSWRLLDYQPAPAGG
jgi:hypothetical protein